LCDYHPAWKGRATSAPSLCDGKPEPHVRGLLETLTITLAALAVSLVLFGAFIYLYEHKSPADLYYWMYKGGFGAPSSLQNTLTKAAPLILAALCTALPARLGLIIIGGEGALVLGGLAAAGTGLLLANWPPLTNQIGMAIAGMVTGGLLIAASGALRHWRGVNATISSLLFTYIALAVFKFLVEGPMRDPASLNKPSTYPIPEAAMLGTMGSRGLEVHWGLAFGIVACFLMWLLMDHTTFGFAARMAGGNVKAAQAAGLPVGFLIVATCFLGGAGAGLAGMVEIAASQRQANASLIAGYGFTGILVSFIARHHPLAILPAAILFGGLSASSGVLQRRLLLNDASVQMLMGTMFVVILLFDTLYGRFRIFQPREIKEVAVT
jgi:simple sugar transport system permease protein